MNRRDNPPSPRHTLRTTAWLVVAVVASLALAPAAAGQRKPAATATLDDYRRAERSLSWNAAPLVSGLVVGPTWFPSPNWLADGKRFWYRAGTATGYEFRLVDPTTGRQGPAFDHARLALAIDSVVTVPVKADSLPIDSFRFLADGHSIQISHQGGATQFSWICDIQNYRCGEPQVVTPPKPTEVPSPDGQWVAYVVDHNLWVRSTSSGKSIQLSSDGVADFGYAEGPQGCCYVVTIPIPTPVVAWSPDSRKILTHRYDERSVGLMHLLESRPGRPVLHSFRYALPGDSVFPTYELHVFDVIRRTSVRIQTEPMLGDFLMMYVPTWNLVKWSAKSDKVLFTRHTPNYQRAELLVADASTGVARTVITEADSTFVDFNQEVMPPPIWDLVHGGSEVVWFSERDGWGHLYLYDVETGALKQQLTKGPWLVNDIVRIDDTNGWIYFTALGRERDDPSPYLPHLYKVQLDGTRLTPLTPGPFDHAVAISPSGEFLVDTYSRPEVSAITVVRSTVDGKVVLEMDRADVSRLLASGWKMPVPFTVKAADGTTDLYGQIHFPSTFDSSRAYPVLTHIYPGPQIGPILTESFSVYTFGEVIAFAELGFIVIQLDTRGTPGRSKPFHDYDYGRLQDNGLSDHIAAIRQLAARYPQMDTSRVGAFGESGGGAAAAAAVLQYPGFFKVAVASSGNHDNQGYFFAWGNKYQGLLVGNNYDQQANQNYASKLQGRLLVTYATMDDNVHPNQSLVLIDSLIAHNKDFDVLVLPNRNHLSGSEPYVLRRIWDYLVRYLQGGEPPPQYLIKPQPGPGGS